MSFRNNKYIDTCPALEAARDGAPGFAGLSSVRRRGSAGGTTTSIFPTGTPPSPGSWSTV